jgi:hypothetical protein
VIIEELIPIFRDRLFKRSDLIGIVANSDIPLPLKMTANILIPTIQQEKLDKIQSDLALVLQDIVDGDTLRLYEILNEILRGVKHG